MTTALHPSAEAPTSAETETPVAAAPPPGASLRAAAILLGTVVLGGLLLRLEPGQNVLDSWGFATFPNVLHSDFLRAMSDLGDAPVTGGVAFVAGASAWRRDRRRALACLGGPGLAVALAEVLKHLVGRKFYGALDWPSGTTAAVTAVVAAVVLVTSGKGRAAAVVIGAAVVIFEAVALVSFRWHYLTDVLGGIVLGVGCVLLVDAVFHRLRRRARRRSAHRGAASEAGTVLRLPLS